MVHTRFLFVWLIAVALGTAVCAGDADDRVSFKQENRPDNLKALFELVHHKIHVERDTKQALALVRSLIPDEARVKPALRDGLAPEMLSQIADQHQKMREMREAEVAKLARPTQKVVQVHAASTEGIARYQEGSVAFREFPGGAKRLAEQVLRPGVTFYEVEFLEPGKDAGMKYHLLYWDGQQWSMLGALWRVLK
jgi:hypothetical protein